MRCIYPALVLFEQSNYIDIIIFLCTVTYQNIVFIMCDSCRTNGRKRHDQRGRDRAHPYFFSFQTIWLLFLILKDKRNIRTLIDKINIILTCCETCARYVFLYIDTPKKRQPFLQMQQCHFTIDIRQMFSSVLMSGVLDIGENLKQFTSTIKSLVIRRLCTSQFSHFSYVALPVVRLSTI